MLKITLSTLALLTTLGLTGCAVVPGPPAYYGPAPVYVEPAPRYYVPPPVYVAPAPFFFFGGSYGGHHHHGWGR